MFRNPYADGLIVVVIVLLFFGPKRLPQLGQSLGQGLREFKDVDHRRFVGRRRRRRAARDSTKAAPISRAAPASHDRAGRRRRRRTATALTQLRRQVALTMAKALRPIGHEDRLSIVDHLDELRSRLIVCGASCS